MEAARAGEQGRGFAVVAAEVRTLAQRSAAAKEIKTLIAASVAIIDAGSASVNAAGSTMGDIVASVQQVNDIIERISEASSEQASGIAEVNLAVGHMDGITQQNAALVEAAAAAAGSLHEQTVTLSKAVSIFKIAPRTTATATATATATITRTATPITTRTTTPTTTRTAPSRTSTISRNGAPEAARCARAQRAGHSPSRCAGVARATSAKRPADEGEPARPKRHGISSAFELPNLAHLELLGAAPRLSLRAAGPDGVLARQGQSKTGYRHSRSSWTNFPGGFCAKLTLASCGKIEASATVR